MSDFYNVDGKKIITVANTHPRISIPLPGIGVGGHCIPVDPYFLIENKNNNELIKTSRKINDARPGIIATKIKRIINLYKLKYKKTQKFYF